MSYSHFKSLYLITSIVLIVVVHFTATCDGATGKAVVKVTYSAPTVVRPGRPVCECKGIEMRSPGRGPRTLKMNCRKGNITVNCEYTGNPHGCSKYNNKGQETFYGQVLNDAGSRICDLNIDRMMCPRGKIVTKLCGNLGENKDFEYTAGP